MAKITVDREVGYADLLRAYRVILDGVEIGRVMKGESLSCDAKPGRHVISAKIDWCSSPTVEFECGDEEVRFNVRSNLKGLKLALGLIYVLFMPSRYLVLERAK